jgi:hypothetical protein
MNTTEPDTLEAESATRLLVRLDEAALVIAMTVVPGLYSRNRMFALFTDARFRRARKRAVGLRLAVRQLSNPNVRSVALERAAAGSSWRLTYELPTLAYGRRLTLSDAERACVLFLLQRSGALGLAPCLACGDDDRALVERTLAYLAPLDEAFRSLASGDR